MSSKAPEKRKLALSVTDIVMILAALNFVAFFVVSQVIGGDALNGREQDGHYFLSDHGKLTEVSKAVFSYSRWHAISTMAGVGIAMVVLMCVKAYRRWLKRP